MKTSSFEKGVSKERNFVSWAACGAAPCTRSCFDGHNQVHREIGDGDDDFNVIIKHIQAANNLSTYFLKEHGYNGSTFKAEINILTKKKKTTVPETREIIEILASATSHGAIFHVTGGGNLTSDNMFRAAQMTSSNSRIKELEDKNKCSDKIKAFETLQVQQVIPLGR